MLPHIKIEENSSDSNRVVRARDDVQVSDFQSIVSDLKNEISRGSYNKEPVLAPKPGKKRSRTTNCGLHCRTCDNVQGGLLSVINLVENLHDDTPNLCSKCLKNFTNEEVLKSHRKRCTGKQFFACTICNEGFTNHHEMVKHTRKWHKADNSFKTTGIFVGKSRLQNNPNMSKLSKLCQVFEKTHVPLISGLNHTN